MKIESRKIKQIPVQNLKRKSLPKGLRWLKGFFGTINNFTQSYVEPLMTVEDTSVDFREDQAFIDKIDETMIMLQERDLEPRYLILGGDYYNQLRDEVKDFTPFAVMDVRRSRYQGMIIIFVPYMEGFLVLPEFEVMGTAWGY